MADKGTAGGGTNQARKVGLPMDFGSIRAVLFDLDGTLYRQPPLRLFMARERCSLPLYGPFRASGRMGALRAFRRAQERLRGPGPGDPVGRQFEEAAARPACLLQ
jgi:FMN phosphatase YigB (HAD superfamily)